jgi:hypothetical protein
MERRKLVRSRWPVPRPQHSRVVHMEETKPQAGFMFGLAHLHLFGRDV